MITKRRNPYDMVGPLSFWAIKEMEIKMADSIDALIRRLEATLTRQEAAVKATREQLEAARKLKGK